VKSKNNDNFETVLAIHYFSEKCIANSLLLQNLYCITVLPIQAIQYCNTLQLAPTKVPKGLATVCHLVAMLQQKLP